MGLLLSRSRLSMSGEMVCTEFARWYSAIAFLSAWFLVKCVCLSGDPVSGERDDFLSQSLMACAS